MRRNYSDGAWRNKRAADRERIAKLRADPTFRASENTKETERYRNLVANNAAFASSVRRSEHEAWELGVCATFEALTELIPDFLSAPISTRAWTAIRRLSNPYREPTRAPKEQGDEMTHALIAEFTKCLGVMSHSRAGWDYDLPKEQRAREDREERGALKRAREIWEENPDIRDALREAFILDKPLATLKEIEEPPAVKSPDISF